MKKSFFAFLVIVTFALSTAFVQASGCCGCGSCGGKSKGKDSQKGHGMSLVH